MEKPILSVVVPVYNEEEVLPECYARLTAVMRGIGESYEIIFVNDGSSDKTLQILTEICQKDANVVAVNFSRNFGHMAALSAGMKHSSGDATIIIDADLQDPPEVIPDMVREWRGGFDVVYGKRKSRAGETLFKKFTAQTYYRILGKLTNIDIPVDTGEFRLISRNVREAFNSLPERNKYIRGLMSWVGFNQKAVEYERQERFAGTTKYPLKKMVKLAIDGITSFSYFPLKLAATIGFFMSFCSFIYLIVIICQRVFTDTTVSGWASTVGIILFTQGIVLIILGIIGEYIGRIFDEIKQRPSYIVKEVIKKEND